MAYSSVLGRAVNDVVPVLVRDCASAFATKAGTRGQPHRVTVEVDVPVGAGQTVLTRAAVVELGQPEWDDCSVRVPLTIAATVGERWFPSFSGQLEAREALLGETELRLVGRYALPLGAVGRLTGHLGGDDLARASLAALFQATIVRIEAVLRDAAPSWRPAPAPDALDRD